MMPLRFRNGCKVTLAEVLNYMACLLSRHISILHHPIVQGFGDHTFLVQQPHLLSGHYGSRIIQYERCT